MDDLSITPYGENKEKPALPAIIDEDLEEIEERC